MAVPLLRQLASVAWSALSGIPANITSWAAIVPSSKADDSAVVHVTGNESVGGTKTFTGTNIQVSAGNLLATGTNNDFRLRALADGTGSAALQSGTTLSSSDGAYIYVAGNSHATNAGQVNIISGTDSNIILQATGSGVVSLPAGGINMGSTVAPGGAQDMSKHIVLYSSSNYGFSVTGNNLNYNAGANNSANHTFYINGSQRMQVGYSTMLYGSQSDGTSDTKTIQVDSNGFAGLVLNGDASNTSGEPGGAYIKTQVDGGVTYSVLGMVQSAGSDAAGGTVTGSSANAALWTANGAIQLAPANSVALTLSTSGDATFGGNVTVSGTLNGYMPTSWTITAGNGITGGGSGAANRTLTLGTPSSITGSSTNSVSSTSHTHAISIDSRDAPMNVVAVNSSITLSSTHINSVVEKSGGTSRTYTIPSGLGTAGTAITFVNSAAGNITIARGSGVSLFQNGTNANIVVGTGSMLTIIKSSNGELWVAP